jgi:two-component system cell cycle response regulator
LTKLYNRHYLDTHLKNLVRQARETNRNLSLVIMDMDHFKQVNDTYGHPVGDEVLVTLAGIIVGSIRSADLAARYGGEEFVILMPETDAARAYEGAERLRKQVESTPFKVSHPVGEIYKTVSIGHATIQPDDTPEKLLQRADHALYEAKNSGRNKVLPMSKPPYAPSPTRVAARSAVEADATAAKALAPVTSMKLDVADAAKPSALPYANKSEF